MLGWHNPCPMLCGGGPSDIESIWRALRSAVGGDKGAGSVDSIEDLARQQEAIALAGAERALERALFQHFPSYSIDALPLWQVLLHIDGAIDEPALREALRVAWLPPDGTTTSSLTADLTAISSQLSIVLEDDDEQATTVPGKYLACDGDVPPFATGVAVGRTSAVFPNYSSSDILRVVYALDGAEVDIPDEVTRAVTKLLHARLPAWQTWFLVTDSGPFLLDGGDHGESVLDLTPLG